MLGQRRTASFLKFTFFKLSPFARASRTSRVVAELSINRTKTSQTIQNSSLSFSANTNERGQFTGQMNKLQANVSEKTANPRRSRVSPSSHSSRGTIGTSRKRRCEATEEQWMDTLAEVRLPRRADELAQPYYPRALWRFDLRPFHKSRAACVLGFN